MWHLRRVRPSQCRTAQGLLPGQRCLSCPHLQQRDHLSHQAVVLDWVWGRLGLRQQVGLHLVNAEDRKLAVDGQPALLTPLYIVSEKPLPAVLRWLPVDKNTYPRVDRSISRPRDACSQRSRHLATGYNCFYPLACRHHCRDTITLGR